MGGVPVNAAYVRDEPHADGRMVTAIVLDERARSVAEQRAAGIARSIADEWQTVAERTDAGWLIRGAR